MRPMFLREKSRGKMTTEDDSRVGPPEGGFKTANTPEAEKMNNTCEEKGNFTGGIKTRRKNQEETPAVKIWLGETKAYFNQLNRPATAEKPSGQAENGSIKSG